MKLKKHASKGTPMALKARADITRNPKHEYQGPIKKDRCPQFFL